VALLILLPKVEPGPELVNWLILATVWFVFAAKGVFEVP
jgi:hypothetical protein